MEQPLSPAALARGLLICTAGVLPAVSAHVAAGGSAPSPVLLLLVLIGLSGATALASSREWTTGSLVLVLSGTQVVVHGVLWLGGAHGGHHATASSSGTTSTLHNGSSMLLWHAVAVAISTVVLRHGERVVHLFARLIASVLPPSADVVPASGPRASCVPAATTNDLRPLLLLRGAVDRRGPPVLMPAH